MNVWHVEVAHFLDLHFSLLCFPCVDALFAYDIQMLKRFGAFKHTKIMVQPSKRDYFIIVRPSYFRMGPQTAIHLGLGACKFPVDMCGLQFQKVFEAQGSLLSSQSSMLMESCRTWSDWAVAAIVVYPEKYDRTDQLSFRPLRRLSDVDSWMAWLNNLFYEIESFLLSCSTPLPNSFS